MEHPPGDGLPRPGRPKTGAPQVPRCVPQNLHSRPPLTSKTAQLFGFSGPKITGPHGLAFHLRKRGCRTASTEKPAWNFKQKRDSRSERGSANRFRTARRAKPEAWNGFFVPGSGSASRYARPWLRWGKVSPLLTSASRSSLQAVVRARAHRPSFCSLCGRRVVRLRAGWPFPPFCA